MSESFGATGLGQHRKLLAVGGFGARGPGETPGGDGGEALRLKNLPLLEETESETSLKCARGRRTFSGPARRLRGKQLRKGRPVRSAWRKYTTEARRTRAKSFGRRRIVVASVAGGLQARACPPSRGQGDAEGRAPPGRALDGDVAGVLLHDAVRDGEAQPRAAPDALRGEEGVVDARDVFGRDADAGVGDLDGDGVQLVRARAQRDVAAAGDGVAGVQEKVGEDLLELAGVAVDARQIFRVLAAQLDAAVAELRLK